MLYRGLTHTILHHQHEIKALASQSHHRTKHTAQGCTSTSLAVTGSERGLRLNMCKGRRLDHADFSKRPVRSRRRMR